MSDKFCAKQLDVLGDQNRLHIIRKLAFKRSTVSEINAHLKIRQNLLSHHLKVLKQAGYIASERVGKNVFYFLTKKIEKRAKKISVHIGCCDLTFEDT